MRKLLVRRYFPLLYAVVAVMAMAGSARSTWDLVLQARFHGNGRPIRAIFFLNDRLGWAGGSAGDGILRTTDGGNSWNVAILPRVLGAVAPDSADVSAISMRDALHGYVAVEVVGAPGKVCPLYVTSDGGMNWVPTQILSGASDVYLMPNGLISTDRGGTINNPATLPGYISTDNGTTFQPSIPPSTNGIDFTDNVHGVITGFQGTHWLYTADGGKTWQPTLGFDTVESWSVFALKGTSTFVTAGENRVDGYNNKAAKIDSLTTIRISRDNGKTWNVVGNPLSFCSTGHITGANGILYIQRCTDFYMPRSGIWRCTDGGRTWVSVGGPSAKKDVRFAVLGCRAEIIFAADDIGNIWRTIDGGDGSAPQYRVPPRFLKLDSVDACAPTDTLINIKNLGCDTLFVTQADISIDSQVVVLDKSGSAAAFPYRILPSDSLWLRLSIEPGSTNTVSTEVVVTIMRNGVATYDTISMTAPIKLRYPLAKAIPLAFDSVRLCLTHDSVITITNNWCAPVLISSLTMQTGVSFAIVNTPTPFTLAAGETKQVTVRFMPQALPAVNDAVIAVVKLQNGRNQWVSMFPVSGIGKPDNVLFISSITKPFIFDTLTRCDPAVTKVFTFTNPGCTNIHITTLALLDTNKKPLIANPVMSSNFKLIDTLRLNDTIAESITATPTTVGLHEGYLQITYHLDGQTQHTILVYYSVYVKRGRVALKLDDSPQDYGEILFCDQKTMPVPVFNDGCDDMYLTSASVAGNGFSVPAGIPMPVKILPQTSYNIPVTFVPTVSGPSASTLTVVTDADADTRPTRTIPLLGVATPTDTMRFEAVTPTLFVKPGDTATVFLTGSRTIKHKLLKKIDLTLEYNGDVMTYWPGTAKSTIPNSTILVGTEQRTGGKTTRLPVTITGTDLSIDSTQPMVELQFFVTVSDSAQTSFTISDFGLNDKNLNFGKCALGVVSDTGTIALEFVCGDALFYHYMKSGEIYKFADGIAPVSSRPYPNPFDGRSASRLRIPFVATRALDARLDILAPSGNVVYSEKKSVASGASSFDIVNPHFASGTYHYRVSVADGTGSHAATGEFVVKK